MNYSYNLNLVNSIAFLSKNSINTYLNNRWKKKITCLVSFKNYKSNSTGNMVIIRKYVVKSVLTRSRILFLMKCKQ